MRSLTKLKGNTLDKKRTGRYFLYLKIKHDYRVIEAVKNDSQSSLQEHEYESMRLDASDSTLISRSVNTSVNDITLDKN